MRVQQIRPIEQVSLDQDLLGALYTQLGEAGAEDLVCRALEELGQRLGACEAHYQATEWDLLAQNALPMIEIAERIGMHAVARVAADVRACIAAGDHTALAATLSRLLQLGERSLTAVWDMQDIPF